MQRGIALFATFCALLSAHAPAAGGDTRLAIEFDGETISMAGAISSDAHELILARTIAEYFPGKASSLDLVVTPAMPAGWALVTNTALRTLADTRQATARITPDRIELRGYAADTTRWPGSLEKLSDHLLPGMQLDARVVRMGLDAPLNRQCIEMTRTAMRGRRIEFTQGSAALSTAAMPLLDELVQIATDCPDAAIVITGHTDSTGDETFNIALSEARAEAVADYLAGAGIAGRRITASGAGSSRPLVDETGPRARRLNRRIEVALRFP
jgi:OOP family OmpA-OmpF porin